MLTPFLQAYEQIEANKAPADSASARFRTALLAQSLVAGKPHIDTLLLLEACLSENPPAKEPERSVYDLVVKINSLAAHVITQDGLAYQAREELAYLLAQVNDM